MNVNIRLGKGNDLYDQIAYYAKRHEISQSEACRRLIITGLAHELKAQSVASIQDITAQNARRALETVIASSYGHLEHRGRDLIGLLDAVVDVATIGEGSD